MPGYAGTGAQAGADADDFQAQAPMGPGRAREVAKGAGPLNFGQMARGIDQRFAGPGVVCLLPAVGRLEAQALAPAMFSFSLYALHPCTGDVAKGQPLQGRDFSERDQVAHFGSKGREQHARGIAGRVFERQLGGAHAFRAQGGARIHHAARLIHPVILLIGVGRPVSGAVQQLECGRRCHPVNHPQPGVDAAAIAFMVVVAQACVQCQVGAQGPFVLDVGGQHLVFSVGVEVGRGWRQVGVRLGDARIAPVVDAPHDLVPGEGGAHPLQFGAPPLAVRCIVVDSDGRVVVDVVARIAVPAGVQPGCQVDAGCQSGRVFGCQAGALVEGTGTRVVELLRKSGRRNAFVALTMRQGH